MIKKELVEEIIKKTALDKNDVVAIVDAAMSTIRQSLSKGENVYLRGFGTFKVKYRKAMKARDISRGEQVEAPAQHVAIFKPGNRLKAIMKKL